MAQALPSFKCAGPDWRRAGTVMHGLLPYLLKISFQLSIQSVLASFSLT
jgi:hypothetical protein